VCDYFYTQVPDRPGQGAKVLNALKEEGVNLSAYVAFRKADKPCLILSQLMSSLQGNSEEGRDQARRAENSFSDSGR
jgi:hypothetical protein